MNDIFWSQLFLVPPVCPPTGCEYTLPCHDIVFDAPNAEEWEKLYSQFPDSASSQPFHEYFATAKLATSFDSIATYCSKSIFGQQVILAFLLALVLSIRMARPKDLLTPTQETEVFRPIQGALDRLYATLPSKDVSCFAKILWNTAWLHTRERTICTIVWHIDAINSR